MYKKMTCIAFGLVLILSVAAADAPAPLVQTEAGKKSLTRIRQLGGLVLEVAQNDQHLEVSYLQVDGKWTDEPLALLKDVKGVVHLNLRGQPVTDEQLAHLKPLTELTHLHLERTKITDKGLENLKPLVNLEYLNLYGTAVSDAGLSSLEGMKKLKKLYVWDTKVTAAGATKLKKAIPGLDVNLGIEDKPEPKKEEKKPEPKKEEKKPAPKKEEKKDKKPEPKKEEKKPEPKKEEKKPQPKKEEKKPEPKKEEKKDKKPEAAKDATKTAGEMAALRKARAAAAEKAYRGESEGLGQTRRFGNVLVLVIENPESLSIWSVRWLQAQRDLSSKHEDHIAALEDHLKRMTKIKKAIENLAMDLIPAMKVTEAEWYRLEAQLWLAKEKMKDKKPEAAQDAAKTANEMTALLKTRAEMAQKAYQAEMEGFKHTKRFGDVLVQIAHAEDAYIWSLRWLQGQIDLSPKHEDHVVALQAHLKRMTELKEVVKNLAKDLLPRFKEDEAEWYRLEAQIHLAKADKKAPKTDEEMAALLKARIAAAEKAYRGEWDGLGQIRRSQNVVKQMAQPENIYTWSVRWLQSQRDLNPKREDHLAALQNHAQRMTELHDKVKQISKDLIPRFKEDETEEYRLEAQLWLAKAK